VNSLNRMAAGLADDALGALFLAWEPARKPWLIAPAMNATMWEHPVTRASRERLGEFGARLLPVGDGRLACGEQGEGRQLEVDALEKLVLQALGEKR
jgi:phosphopantothenoylcysteine decarboxylase